MKLYSVLLSFFNQNFVLCLLAVQKFDFSLGEREIIERVTLNFLLDTVIG